MILEILKSIFFFYSVLCCAIGGYVFGRELGGPTLGAVLAIASLAGIWFIIQEYHTVSNNGDAPQEQDKGDRSPGYRGRARQAAHRSGHG